MRLVLKAGDERMALSYGELHELRGELLRATVLALDSLPSGLCEPSGLERVRNGLLLAFDAEPENVEWMLAADRPAPQPNYEALPLDIPAGGLPDVVLNALSGLHWFVCHSDCDGFHSAGQGADVGDWFLLIAAHVRTAWKDRFQELQRLYAQRAVVTFLG